MKIGILTIQKSVVNYGASLQSYALWRFVSSRFGNCEVMDLSRPCHPEYIPSEKFVLVTEKIKRTRLRISLSSILKKLKAVNRTQFPENANSERCRLFEEFNDMITYSEGYSCIDELYAKPPLYDIYITGSDQVWNPYMPFVKEPYFLTFAPRSAKRISYASSFGISELPSEVQTIYKKWLMEYDNISVRENSGKIIIQEMLNEKDVQVVLDPTFLIDINDWKKLADPPVETNDYLLIYVLNGNKELINYGKRIASENGSRVYLILSSYSEQNQKDVNQISNAGPRQWLGWILKAKFIITDSFHGTIFSMLFGKSFYTFIKNQNNGFSTGNRIINLLEMFNLEKHCLRSQLDQSASELARIKFDYTSFLIKLEFEKGKSFRYLINAIEGYIFQR